MCFCLSKGVLLSLAFSAFWQENIEEADLDQCLECSAPKHWSKYTTYDLFGAFPQEFCNIRHKLSKFVKYLYF